MQMCNQLSCYDWDELAEASYSLADLRFYVRIQRWPRIWVAINVQKTEVDNIEDQNN